MTISPLTWDLDYNEAEFTNTLILLFFGGGSVVYVLFYIIYWTT